MALYYYIEVSSQCSLKEIAEIRKPISDSELDDCSLVITVTKDMVKRFNKI